MHLPLSDKLAPSRLWPTLKLLLTYNGRVIVCHWVSLLAWHNDSCATCHGISWDIRTPGHQHTRGTGAVGGRMQSHILMMCVKCRCCCCQFCGPQWRGSLFPLRLFVSVFPMAAVASFMLLRGQLLLSLLLLLILLAMLPLLLLLLQLCSS